MTIGHYHIHLLVLKLFFLEAEECDVTQLNQLDLNSPFPIRLFINWLTFINLFTEEETIIKIWIIV